jgi:hypothetical protein
MREKDMTKPERKRTDGDCNRLGKRGECEERWLTFRP